jgi:hypothetical protein
VSLGEQALHVQYLLSLWILIFSSEVSVHMMDELENYLISASGFHHFQLFGQTKLITPNISVEILSSPFLKYMLHTNISIRSSVVYI